MVVPVQNKDPSQGRWPKKAEQWRKPWIHFPLYLIRQNINSISVVVVQLIQRLFHTTNSPSVRNWNTRVKESPMTSEADPIAGGRLLVTVRSKLAAISVADV